MAKPSYQCTVISLGKTNLGESDIIVTALKQDGSLLRAVAKGGRKPTNPFAARLDIFSVSECLIAKGRSLDIFSEARSVQPNLNVREDVSLSTAGYPIVQALAKTCQEGLQSPRLFEMSRMALSTMDRASHPTAPSITAAFLLKLITMQGFRPNLTQCSSCGQDIELTQNREDIAFSYLDGGCLCSGCASSYDTLRIPSLTLSWCNALLMSTFADILDMDVPTNIAFDVLQVCHGWLRQTMGLNLKSLNAMFTYGLW